MRNYLSFGGMHKNSLVDYPGKIASVVFLSGCNFRCPYCHNPELSIGSVGDDLSVEDLVTLIGKSSKNIDGVVISGGEPTIQAELPALCDMITKELGLPIKLDTNGSNPEMVKHLISKKTVKYIAMDIKTVPGRYREIAGRGFETGLIYDSIDAIMWSGIDHEFRIPCASPLLDAYFLRVIGSIIDGAKMAVLQRVRTEKTLAPMFFKPYSETEIEQAWEYMSKKVKDCFVR